MQVVLHTGAHSTDENRLMQCLLANRRLFGRSGVAVPAPENYRKLLAATLRALSKASLQEGARDIFLDAILGTQGPRRNHLRQPARLILSDQGFFGTRGAMLRRGMFYPNAEQKIDGIRQLFPQDEITIFMAIRNPATLLPAVYERARSRDWDHFLKGTDPRELQWSRLFTRLRRQFPDIAITVWCNEDTPLIWAQIIRDMADLAHGTKITGGFDVLARIMSREGMKRFRAFLQQHPVMTEVQKRRVMSAFLERFVIEGADEEVIDAPGWTHDLIDELTETYEEDLFAIQRIPGVTLVTP